MISQAKASVQGVAAQPLAAEAQNKTSFEQQLANQKAEARENTRNAALKGAEGAQASRESVAAAISGRGSSGSQPRANTESTPFQATSVQNGRGPEASQQTEQTARTAPRATTPEAQRVMDQVKVNISKAIDRGVDHIKIQLRPASLGRIDVKLEVGSNGQVQATIVADKADTLDMLRADRSGLERALQDAGLKTDDSSLNFELRGQNHQDARSNKGGGPNGAPLQGTDDADDYEDTILSADALRAQQANARGGVDVRI